MITKTLLRMTASERALGRFMRAPDGHPEQSAEQGTPPAEAQDGGEPEQLTTEQQFDKEFIQYDDDVQDDESDSEEDDGDDLEGDEVEDNEEDEDEGDNAEESEAEVEDTKESKAMRERAEAAEAEASRLRKLAEDKGIDLDTPVQEALPEQPDPDDYTYGEHDEKFIKDLAKYEAKMEIISDQAQTRIKVEAATLDARWQKNLVENQGRYTDFDEVVVKGAQEGKWACPPVISLAIKDSDHGVDIAYKLASTPAEAERIAKLSPLEQAREFGRMEAEMGFQKATQERETAKKATTREARRVSNAPKPPAKKVRGGGGVSRTNADTDDFGKFEQMADKVLEKAHQRYGR